MAEILFFHHALGLTPGCVAFGEDLRAAGHKVHTPDLYAGRTFAKVTEGVAHAQEIGFDTIIEMGRQIAETLPAGVVYGGFSLGVMPAQKLAQSRPGCRGAVLCHAAVPTSYFGPWPAGVPLQMHTMEKDDLGDVDIAKQLAQDVAGAELFLYPGSGHLFADRSVPDYEPASADLLLQRVLEFLKRVG